MERWIELIGFLWCAHSIMMEIYRMLDKWLVKGELKLPKFISCAKCFSFWAVLIVSLNPLLAGIVGAGVAILDALINYLRSNSKIMLNE